MTRTREQVSTADAFLSRALQVTLLMLNGFNLSQTT